MEGTERTCLKYASLLPADAGLRRSSTTSLSVTSLRRIIPPKCRPSTMIGAPETSTSFRLTRFRLLLPTNPPCSASTSTSIPTTMPDTAPPSASPPEPTNPGLCPLLAQISNSGSRGSMMRCPNVESYILYGFFPAAVPFAIWGPDGSGPLFPADRARIPATVVL